MFVLRPEAAFKDTMHYRGGGECGSLLGLVGGGWRVVSCAHKGKGVGSRLCRGGGGKESCLAD
jgi:hypothetical protein